MSAVPELNGQPLHWPKLINDALTMPGGMGNTYSRFYPGGYSFGNQILLWMQGAEGPVNTYDRWGAMGRQVIKGSKAMSILRPIMVKQADAKGVEQTKVRGFKMVKCLFQVSQTEGEELPPFEPPTWNRQQALDTLGIREIPFNHLDGDCQGFSTGKNIAINPVAAYPLKTTWHELGHVVLGHTEPGRHAEYVAHRGLSEFQAEATAYLGIHELGCDEQMDAAESREYIQHWLRGHTPEDRDIKQVFSATTSILKVGRMAVNGDVAT